MLGLWQDIRYGIRSLARNRAMTMVSLAILAMGIGAITALFTLANAVLYRPLAGVRNPGELVRLVRLERDRQYSNSGYPDYADYRDRNRLLTGLVAERGIPLSFAHGNTERVSGAIVTGNYFEVLGVKTALGRLFGPEDDQIPDARAVAVISHSFWKRMFAGDREVIGRTLILNGYSFTVLGVTAEDFHGMNLGEQISIWVPMMMVREAMPRNANSSFLGARSAGWLALYGRLRPGVRIEQGQAEIASIASGLQREYPETNRARSATLTRDVGLGASQRRELSELLGLLLASVGLLLFIACENVANLFLTRAAGRRREIAIRLAVGAGKWRLIRQLLIESMLLCVAAAGLGLLITPFTLDLALRLLGPSDVAFRAPATVDGTVLLFALGLTLATGLLFGLVPALQASKTDVVTSLKATAALSGELRRGRTPRLATVLVIGQVAISAVLAVGAGLLVQTMIRIVRIDRGFQTERVLMAAVDLAIQRYSEAQGKQFCERLIGTLSELPEVESASLSKSEPARDWSDRRPVFHPDQEPPPEALRRNHDLGLMVDANRISPGYFRWESAWRKDATSRGAIAMAHQAWRL